MSTHEKPPTLSLVGEPQAPAFEKLERPRYAVYEHPCTVEGKLYKAGTPPSPAVARPHSPALAVPNIPASAEPRSPTTAIPLSPVMAVPLSPPIAVP